MQAPRRGNQKDKKRKAEKRLQQAAAEIAEALAVLR
jgi:hypothetical protein